MPVSLNHWQCLVQNRDRNYKNNLNDNIVIVFPNKIHFQVKFVYMALYVNRVNLVLVGSSKHIESYRFLAISSVLFSFIFKELFLVI